MKKRWLGVALSAVMTVGLLAGCGGKTDSTPTGSAGSSSADTSAAERRIIRRIIRRQARQDFA